MSGAKPVVLPPAVRVELGQEMRAYWLDRVSQVMDDCYAGVPLLKFPEDLRVYEHLLWDVKPDTVIELGTHHGGGALWFRDRLLTLQSYGLVSDVRVVSIDIDQTAARDALRRADPLYAEAIHLVEGNVCDEQLVEAVRPLVGGRCFIVEDSAHTYDTTKAALEQFSRFVPPGGYFVVEDGCVDIDEMRLVDDWPRGVLPALGDWLASEQGSEFRVRRDLELYGISCHPGGFLQRQVSDHEQLSPR